jgi:hypothetical protein
VGLVLLALYPIASMPWYPSNERPWAALVLVFFASWAAHAWRALIVVHDRRIHRRTLWSWSSPIDVQRLARVSFRWEEQWRLPFRVLRLEDDSGHRLSIVAAWWARWWELAELAAAEVRAGHATADHSTRRRLKIGDAPTRNLFDYVPPEQRLLHRWRRH